MRPTDYPEWANNADTDPVTGAANKIAPTEEFKLVGLKRGLPLPRAFINYQLDLLNQWVGYLDQKNLDTEVSDDSATINVDGFGMVYLSNTVATTVTSITATPDSYEITLIATNGNTTLQNNANIVLSGGVDLVMAANDAITLKKSSFTSGQWVEVSRSIK